MTEYKQVIIIRKDLNMRKGKMCAQAAHASMAAIIEHQEWYGDRHKIILDTRASNWIRGRFTKVVVGIEKENEFDDLEDKLHKLHSAASSFGMLCSIIKDAGKTEFNGVPTYTAVAIGPDTIEKVDAITGHLDLL
jgi:PTH2 family peptidyl-tRNA hydrolase